MSSFDRHVRRMKYGKQIISSLEFSKVREVLKSDAITDEEINQLWEKGLLGVYNPEGVINWLFIAICFGLRGSDEHRSMSWGTSFYKKTTELPNF